MNNLQIVREAVIKAVPEIMELKFGCEVDRGANIKSKEVVVGFFGEEIALVRRHPTIGDFLPFKIPIELKSEWKILGRPIRLADVLIAMQKIHCDAAIMVDYNGQFWNCDDDMKIFKEVGEPWDISKDDLSLQSPETLEFLANLLK